MQRRISLIGILIVLFILGTSLVQAQESPLTLSDCVKLAIEKNSTLKMAGYSEELAGADVLSSWSYILPRIDLGFTAGRYIQGQRLRKMDVQIGTDPETGQVIYAQREVVQSSVERNSYSASLSYNQTLFDFGRNFTLLNQARANYNASELTYLSTRQAVILDVKQKYFELLKAIKLLEVYEETVSSSEEQLNRTESMYEIGSVAQADVYKARVTLGNSKINLISQENNVNIARGNLNVAMGRSPEMSLRIVEVEPTLTPFPYTMNDALGIAVEKNPELAGLERTMHGYKLGMRASKLAFLPSFGIGAYYNRNNEFFDKVYTTDLDRDYSIQFGASMDLNIFNGFTDKAAYNRQSAYYKNAKEDLADRRRQLVLDVHQAFQNLEAMRKIAEINEDILISAEEDLRLAEERYRVGAGTLLEINDARVAVTEAKQVLISAKYDTETAKASLEAVMGILEE